MAALELTLSIFSSINPSYLTTKTHSSSLKPSLPISTSFKISNNSIPILSFKTTKPHKTTKRLFLFDPCCSSAVEEAVIDQQVEETQEEPSQKKKLYVVNLPWSHTANDIEAIFSPFGNVNAVEVIKLKNGKSRGFAFVTMENSEDALAAIEKLNQTEVSGRTIKVEFAKQLKRPPPPNPNSPGSDSEEARYKLYVSNLAWSARSGHLRDFFSAEFKPVSTRVLFDNASRRASGYGFVSFATKEEAEAAISALNGKELLGREVRIKFSERNESLSTKEQEKSSESKSNESVSPTDESLSSEEASE
ncbi:hypothetical protein ACFE04_032023 [Oxalis oulophora]